MTLKTATNGGKAKLFVRSGVFMNAFQKKLVELPALRERIGQEKADKFFVELLLLVKELDIEMDGVECPSSVAAIINRFRSISDELD